MSPTPNSARSSDLEIPSAATLGENYARREVKWILGGLLMLGLLMRLPSLREPREVVFDEFHWGKYSSAYCCTHEWFWDVHPPHAKLVIGAAARIAGYGGGFRFDRIGMPIPEDVPIFMMRLPTALTGVVLPALVFILLLQLGGSTAAAFMAGLFMALDSALWVQSRYLSLDGFLLVSIVAAMNGWLASRKRHSLLEKLPWLVLAGSAAGFALGSKYTGLTAIGLLGLGHIVDFLQERTKKALSRLSLELGIVLGAFAAVFLAGWYIHFQIQWLPGPGDAFFKPTGNFWSDLYHQQRVMMVSNNAITAVHHDSSKWWSWPWMVTPIYYWVKEQAVIYFVGNPLVWWGTAVIFVAGMVTHALRGVTKLAYPKDDISRPILWIPFVGFWSSFLPYAAVSRPLFLYHYLPPLIFCTTWSFLWLDRIGWTRPGKLTEQRRSFYVVAGLAVAGFLVMMPFTSGLPFGGAFRKAVFTVFPAWP